MPKQVVACGFSLRPMPARAECLAECLRCLPAITEIGGLISPRAQPTIADGFGFIFVGEGLQYVIVSGVLPLSIWGIEIDCVG
jgi:hypothetical protein